MYPFKKKSNLATHRGEKYLFYTEKYKIGRLQFFAGDGKLCRSGRFLTGFGSDFSNHPDLAGFGAATLVHVSSN
jgi:hypothetical protein